MKPTTPTNAFNKPILIHAAANSRDECCTRDILVSSSMTLYQLHNFILIAFGLEELYIEHHRFTTLAAAVTSALDIETSYEAIGNFAEHSLDGFITQVAPGVYIEHTHPHEPLPLFSIYDNESEQHNKMSFRLLRDERYCTLESLTSSRREIYYYEFSNSTKNFCITLNLQAVDLPRHFLTEIELNPRIINRKGQMFTSNKMHQHYHYNPHSKFTISMPPINATRQGKTEDSSYNVADEVIIKRACQKGIERLVEERKRFLIYQQEHQQQQQKECGWVEPSGERCVYCTLTMQ